MNDYEKGNGFFLIKYNEVWIYNIVIIDILLGLNDWIYI